MPEEPSTPDESIAPENVSPDEERPALPQDEALEVQDVPADEIPVPLDDEPDVAKLAADDAAPLDG